MSLDLDALRNGTGNIMMNSRSNIRHDLVFKYGNK